MARVADSRQSHERLLNVTHRRFQDALVLLVTPHLPVLLSLVHLSCGVRSRTLRHLDFRLTASLRTGPLGNYVLKRSRINGDPETAVVHPWRRTVPPSCSR